jgi:hypothetical protein
MSEFLLNKYVKIVPLEHKQYLPSDNNSYQEIGKVVNWDKSLTGLVEGCLVYFDSFMAKKYPIEGDDDNFQWFIEYSEIVKIEYPDVAE